MYALTDRRLAMLVLILAVLAVAVSVVVLGHPAPATPHAATAIEYGL